MKSFTALKDLENKFKNVTIEITNNPKEARGYYKELRFRIFGISNRGRDIELVDGGGTNWTQRLLGNAKERLVISGIGTDRLCESFAPIDLGRIERSDFSR